MVTCENKISLRVFGDVSVGPNISLKTKDGFRNSLGTTRLMFLKLTEIRQFLCNFFDLLAAILNGVHLMITF